MSMGEDRNLFTIDVKDIRNIIKKRKKKKGNQRDKYINGTGKIKNPDSEW